jgi:hypothetical protein
MIVFAQIVKSVFFEVLIRLQMCSKWIIQKNAFEIWQIEF